MFDSCYGYSSYLDGDRERVELQGRSTINRLLTTVELVISVQLTGPVSPGCGKGINSRQITPTANKPTKAPIISNLVRMTFAGTWVSSFSVINIGGAFFSSEDPNKAASTK